MKENRIITELEDLKNVVSDVVNLTWRTRSGEDVRLVDMTQEQLQRVYNHTTDMLYNKSVKTPGKYNVIENIKTLSNNCNAELFLRFLKYDCQIDMFKDRISILEYVRARKKEDNLKNSDSISLLFHELPQEFETINIETFIMACLLELGTINRRLISDEFIIAKGIWLTNDEKEDLTEYDEEGKMIPWMTTMKERLMLNNVNLRVNSNGFSYEEFRQLIHLEPFSKIKDLPTNCLRLLRDKVLIMLISDNEYHIKKWEQIKENIETVANYNKITLTLKKY